MQSDDRRLLDRAKRWAAAIKGEFQAIPVPPDMPVAPPPAESVTKMF
jgi:hypothetical protein